MRIKKNSQYTSLRCLISWYHPLYQDSGFSESLPSRQQFIAKSSQTDSHAECELLISLMSTVRQVCSVGVLSIGHSRIHWRESLPDGKSESWLLVWGVQ